MPATYCWTGLAAATVISLACARPPETLPSPAPEKVVEFSVLEDYDKGDDLDEVAKDFDLFRQLGVKVWRGSFGWDHYEPERGQYDFSWLHRFAELAHSRDITLRPYLAYTPGWASGGGADPAVWNDPPADVDDWARFTRALASALRVHSNIASYEIYNAQNIAQWWDGTPGVYADVLRRGAEAIRSADPDASVLFGGLVSPDAAWLASVCAQQSAGVPVDVIPFHAYPETWTPPGVTVENYLGRRFHDDFVEEADASCGRKRLWINQTGYATTPGRSERDQAAWWARAVATFFAAPRIDHIGIYEIKDLPRDRAAVGDQPDYHLGISRADRSPKLAFGTVARLVALFNGRRIRVADSGLEITAMPSTVPVHRHLFIRSDETQILFLWTRESDALVTVRLPERGTRAVEYAIDGTRSGEHRITGSMTLANVELRRGDVRIFEIEP